MCPKKPTFALLYDFDKTLCTKDMQEYSFIPDVNMTPEAFWQAANTLAREQKMDGILAYMYVMTGTYCPQTHPSGRFCGNGAGSGILSRCCGILPAH